MKTDGKCPDCCDTLRGGKCTNAECESSPYHDRINKLESALKKMQAALASALDEAGGKKVADWKVINEAACEARDAHID